jgi:hypothetical protein
VTEPRAKEGDLDAVIQQLKIGQVILVAHDASGPPAIELNLNMPISAAGSHYECQRVGENVGTTQRKLRLREKPKSVVCSLTSGFKLTLAAQQCGEGQNAG